MACMSLRRASRAHGSLGLGKSGRPSIRNARWPGVSHPGWPWSISRYPHQVVEQLLDGLGIARRSFDKLGAQLSSKLSSLLPRHLPLRIPVVFIPNQHEERHIALVVLLGVVVPVLDQPLFDVEKRRFGGGVVDKHEALPIPNGLVCSG